MGVTCNSVFIAVPDFAVDSYITCKFQLAPVLKFFCVASLCMNWPSAIYKRATLFVRTRPKAALVYIRVDLCRKDRGIKVPENLLFTKNDICMAVF
jgi:predicted naringenin-chalcone synthase